MSHLYLYTAAVLGFDSSVLTGLSVSREQLANSCIWWKRLVCLHRPGTPTGLIEKTQARSIFIEIPNVGRGPDLESLHRVPSSNSFTETSKSELIPDQRYFCCCQNRYISGRDVSHPSVETHTRTFKSYEGQPAQLDTPDA